MGAGNPTISGETETQVQAACQPRQPHTSISVKKYQRVSLPMGVIPMGVLIDRAAAAKSLQSCPTLCDPIDGSPPGSPIPGILQARTMEWVAISFSNASKWKVKVKLLSHVRLFVTP